jgi:hypothetical protein
MSRNHVFRDISGRPTTNSPGSAMAALFCRETFVAKRIFGDIIPPPMSCAAACGRIALPPLKLRRSDLTQRSVGEAQGVMIDGNTWRLRPFNARPRGADSWFWLLLEGRRKPRMDADRNCTSALIRVNQRFPVLQWLALSASFELPCEAAWFLNIRTFYESSCLNSHENM